MKSQPTLIPIALILFFSSFFSFAENVYTEGYFDYFQGQEKRINKEETGRFIKKINEHSGFAEIKGGEVKVYIAEDLKGKWLLEEGVLVLLLYNPREEYRTEWDIISIIKKPAESISSILILQPPPAETEAEEVFPSVSLAPLTITTDSTLSGGTEGSEYSQTLSASGGTPPYRWSLISGSLPDGLSLNSKGIISGTPGETTASAAPYSFTVRVTDSVGATADKAFTLKISGYDTIDWSQANTSGFGTANNTIIYVMTTFGSHIYAGTWNSTDGAQIWRSSDGTNWLRVNTSGFGSANNTAVISMVVLGDYLYAGTLNTVAGGQVWRSIDGTTWSQVHASGFGSASNRGIYAMAVLDNYIYAGTVNTATGCQVWRSNDGVGWTQVVANGFGTTNNSLIFSMAVFNNRIYAGTNNTTMGAQVWSSDSGTSWTQANTSGFGDINNLRINTMAVFDNFIYAGTRNTASGGQIWRSSDGTTWTRVSTNGFGAAGDIGNYGLAVFNSYIYSGTARTGGSQIWRSINGTTWTQHNADGFGNVNNIVIHSPAVFGNYLYVGTQNTVDGGQIWRYYEVYIDPNITGRVYDSLTGEDINSPITNIYREGSAAVLYSTTDNPYSFNVDDGKYYLRVEKEGYTFPSNTIDGITPGDHGEVFTITGTKYNIDIPIDAGYPLEITKTANKRKVVNGDIITYDIKIKNNSMWDQLNIDIIDEITNGFKYVTNSAYIDNTQLSRSNISISGRKGTFKLSNVPGYAVTHLTYQVRVGTGINPGEYKTTAVAWDRVRDWRMSNETSNKIEVVYDALFTMGTIIGKVFYDANGNGVQDTDKIPNPKSQSPNKSKIPNSKSEIGISGVKIYTEYGVVVETDRDGKYHIPAVPPGNHLLKVDLSTLPEGAEFTTDNPCFVKITEGLLAKVNFGVSELTSERVSELAGKEEPADTQTRKPVNQFFIVALGEGVVRGMDTDGNIDMVEQGDRYDDDLRVDGKLALYLKGKVKGKYLVTASFDTDRRSGRRGKMYEQQKLFTNLDPDKYYPVYGDSSKISFDAADTQDELYLLVEWDKSHIKWGSFNTDIPLYNRTMQGASIVYESIKETKFKDPYTKINAFYARAYQQAAHDEFLGTGGSLYYIRHTPVIEGSEKVRVELRHQISKEVIAETLLMEERDYEIDYDTGRILLKKPLSSVNYDYNASIISNDILSGAKVYLIIDYEYESTSSIRREAYGIRASRQVQDHLRIGGTYIEEEKSGRYYKLMGGDSTVKLNEYTELVAEYSRSEETQNSGAHTIDGGLTYNVADDTVNNDKTGSSFSVKGKTRLFDNTDINAGYTRQDDNYSATNTISTQGSSIYTGSILTRVRDNILIGVKHITQEIKDTVLAMDLAGNNKVHTTTGLIDYTPNKWDIRLEYQHQETENPFTDFTYAGTRQLMDHDIIGGRVGYKLNNKIHPYIGGQVTVQNQVNNQGYIGAMINIWKNTNIRIKETVGNLGNSTFLGITSQILPGTEAYTNIEVGNNAQLGERFTKTATGQRTQIDENSTINWEKDYSSYNSNVLRGELIGYDTKLSDTISLGANYERAEIEKEKTAVSRDTGSITLSYLNINWLKTFSKLELREDRGTDTKRQWLTQNNLLWQITQDISLAGRANWSITDNRTQDSTDTQFHEMGVGFAYRPLNFDRLNLLAKYSYITNDRPESQDNFIQTQEDIRHVYAVEGAFDICRYLQLVGKFAMRDLAEKVGPRDWTDSETYLYIGRLNFHVTRKWDLAAEYRNLANKQIEDNKSGWLLEVDREIGKYVRLGAGYNFTDYDDNLGNDDYDAKGWFIRVNGEY